MPLYMVEKDIVTMKVDAIVNSSNTQLLPGGGASGAIYHAAGREDLDRACKEIGHCPLGGAVITGGFKLPAKYVIHVAGPRWEDGTYHEEELLTSCYQHALILALEHGCKSIAFPLISSGIYGYPKKEALQVAIKTIRDFLLEADLVVYMVVYDRFKLTVSEKIKVSLDDYLNKHYENQLTESANLHPRYRNRRRERFESHYSHYEYDDVPLEIVTEAEEPAPAPVSQKKLGSDEHKTCQDAPVQIQESNICYNRVCLDLEELRPLMAGFSQTLQRLIQEKGFNEVTVYKEANLDRKLYSKIKNKKDYKPSKQTAISLALALHLSIYETEDLLARAGYALSPASRADIIIEYCLLNGLYDIIEVNDILSTYGQKPLGPA